MIANPSEHRDELQQLETKHARNPDGRYFVPLANARRKAGDVDGAVQLLREGLERNRDYLSARIVLGRCFVDQGDLGAAAREFEYVLGLDPQNLIALRTLGDLAVGAGNLDEARKWYGELLTVDPMNEEARRTIDQLRGADPGEEKVPSPPAGSADRRIDGSITNEAPPILQPSTTASQAATPFPDKPAIRSDQPEGDSQSAVVTETIAELYTRQGFYDRAAAVYRELIRRRGPDPALTDRLKRVEELARPALEAMDEATLPTGLEVDPTPTSSLPPAGGPQMGLTGDTSSEPSSISGYAAEDDTRADEGTTANNRADQIADGAASSPSSTADIPAPSELDDAFAASVAAFDDGSAEPPATASLTAEDVGGRKDIPQQRHTAAPEWTAAPRESIGEYLRGVLSWHRDSANFAAPGQPSTLQVDEKVVDERTRTDITRPEPEIDHDAGAVLPGMVSGYESGLGVWDDIPATAPGEPEEDSTESNLPPSGPSVDPRRPSSLDLSPMDRGPLTSDPAEAGASGASDSKDEDDDDLESFQAWLRSLKK